MKTIPARDSDAVRADVIRALTSPGPTLPAPGVTVLRSRTGVASAAARAAVLAIARDAADAKTEGPGTIFGYANVSDVWTEIDSIFEGNFLERFAEGAWKKTIRERRDRVRVQFNHGMDWQIDQKLLGKLSELKEDAEGLWQETPLDDTSYNRDLAPSIESGALDGQSVRFRVLVDEWVMEPPRSDYNPDGIPERTIREAALYELGPVTWPAYEATTVGIRSREAAAIWFSTPPAERAQLLQMWGIDPSRAGTATLADVITASPSGTRTSKREATLRLLDMEVPA
jgi:HK97 family phage prohead protease